MSKFYINPISAHAAHRAIITESDYVRVKLIRTGHRTKYFKSFSDAENYIAKRGFVSA